ncbi:MAG: rubrerythrin family protein [Clostridia bacterium]|nr:rubrerythrin family protein [Clostridia bacterium]
MPVSFKDSETRINLMKAFACESQARNRYTFAAAQARTQQLHVIDAVFTFTANQEKEHAEIFYNFLREANGENIGIDGSYPVNLSASAAELLRAAEHNEFEEYDPVYRIFGEKAKEEGFARIGQTFLNIAEIEKTHGERFGMLAELLEQDKLFVSDVACKWICLNCGFVYEGTAVPKICPVCEHDRGFFIRLELAPFTK